MCNRYDSIKQEADLTEDIVVDEEASGCVKILCNLGDTLDGDGGADLATTAQHQKWMEAFQRVFLPFATFRAPLLETTECMPVVLESV